MLNEEKVKKVLRMIKKDSISVVSSLGYKNYEDYKKSRQETQRLFLMPIVILSEEEFNDAKEVFNEIE